MAEWLGSGSSAGDEAEEPGENDGAQEGYEDAVEEAAGAGEAEQPEDKATCERAKDADDDVAEDTEAAALHDFAGQPTGDEPDQNPPKNPVHRSSFLMRIVVRGVLEHEAAAGVYDFVARGLRRL